MFWIVVASQVAAANPTSSAPFFRVEDFPEYVEQGGKNYSIYTRTLVGPEGKILWCDVETPSTEPRLDKYTCDIIVKRARFSPARWIDGSPSYGLFRLPVRWALDDPTESEPDLSLTVSALPDGVKSPAHIRLRIAVDADAKPASCDSEPLFYQPKQTQPDNPDLVRLACDEFLKLADFYAPRDERGAAVRSVQNASVRITKRPK